MITLIKYGVITKGNHPKLLASFNTLQEAKFNAKKYTNVIVTPIVTYDRLYINSR